MSKSLRRKSKSDFPKLSLFASWTGAMINHQWLELSMFRTNFHGPKDVRAIESRPYNSNHYNEQSKELNGDLQPEHKKPQTGPRWATTIF